MLHWEVLMEEKMPLYSVRLRDIGPHVKHGWMTVHQIQARSHGAATLRLEATNPGSRVRSIRKIKQVDRDYWRKIWHQAYENMPSLVRVVQGSGWIEQAPGATHLPKFIKQQAKGKMRIRDGVVEKFIVNTLTYRKSKEACLAELLQYCKADRRCHNLRAMAILRGMALGLEPRTVTKHGAKGFDRRAMLLVLAGKNGKKLALAAFAEKFGR